MAGIDVDLWLPSGGVVLRDPAGGELAADVAELAVTSRASIPERLTLEVVVAVAAWPAIDAGAWFHLLPAVRGPGPDFPDGAPVQLELRLDDEVLADVFTGQALTAEDAWAGLRGGEGEWAAARATEAWFALRVRQELVPGVAAGFVTTWDEADEVVDGMAPEPFVR